MSSPPLPLVAITRQTEQSVGLEAMLRARGFDVLMAPAIRRVPPESWAELDRGIAGLRAGRYDGLLFTSPAAVQPFAERWRVAAGEAPGAGDFATGAGERGAEARPAGALVECVEARSAGALAECAEAPLAASDFAGALSGKWIAAVGPGTAAALRTIGLDPQVISGKGTGADLAEALISRLGSETARMRFLLPRALEGREELAKGLGGAGAYVDIVAAYRTIRASADDLEPLAAVLRQGRATAVVFASPSAVDAVLAVSSSDLGGALAVAIGETTAGALRAAGVRRIVAAAHPDDTSMVQALQDGLRST